MSNKQNKERLSSGNRRDGYFSTCDSEVQKTTLLTVDSQRVRSCAPCLSTATPTPTAWSYQCKTPYHQSWPLAHQQHAATSALALNLSATTIAASKKPTTTTATAIISASTTKSSNVTLKTTATKITTTNQNQNKIQQAGPAIRTRSVHPYQA